MGFLEGALFTCVRKPDFVKSPLCSCCESKTACPGKGVCVLCVFWQLDLFAHVWRLTPSLTLTFGRVQRSTYPPGMEADRALETPRPTHLLRVLRLAAALLARKAMVLIKGRVALLAVSRQLPSQPARQKEHMPRG